MPRGAVRRVMKKKDKKHVKRQNKKKVGSNTNSNMQVKQQQNLLPQMGYMKQQYGNPDLAMQEEEKKRFLDEIRKNEEEIQKLRSIIDENPRDHEAIMEYYTKKIAAQERVIGQGKHHREILEDKESDIQYLRRKNQELRNKANDQRIDSEILDENLSYDRKEDLNENIAGSVKDIVRLNNQIEEKRGVISTMEAIKQKKKENRELAEEIEEFDRSTRGDRFRQQNEKMVELEMQLEDENIESAKLHQMKSEQKRLDQAQLANEAKGRVISASILQGQGYDEAPVVDQVNNMIDSGSCTQQDSFIGNKSTDSFDGDQLSRSPNPYYSKNDNFEEEESN